MIELFKTIGLDSDPFTTSPNVEKFYPATQHRQCLEGLELAIRMRRGLSVIRGGIGVGKTTVSRKLIEIFKNESNTYNFHLILDPKFDSELIFLKHIIDLFGIKTTGVDVQGCRNIIENYLSDINNNTKINYIREKKFLGTAGSLSLLKSKFNNDIIITNCDTIVEINFKEILDYHKKNKYDLTVVASTKEIEVPYGTCVTDSLGELKKLKEKPKYNLLVNVGFYVLKPEILELVKNNTYLSMTNFINYLQSKNYKIGVYPCHENFWKDIGQWEEYEKSLKNLRY